MDENELAEYVDRLLRGESIESLEAKDELLKVAQQLRNALRPLTPPPEFRQSLKERLLAYSEDDRASAPVGSTTCHMREIVVGAAVLSLAGAALLFWRNRTSIDTAPPTPNVA